LKQLKELTEQQLSKIRIRHEDESCNNCFWGQYPPTCGRTGGELCDNGWCGYYERLVDES
jgi:hypothetical protein